MLPDTASPAPDWYVADDQRHRRGSTAFRRARGALFSAGVATFVLVYSTQALLPALSSFMHLTPGQASLTVSATSLGLAIGILPVSALSEKFGRTPVMTLSVFSAALLAAAIPLSPDLAVLVALRAVQGLCLAGLPATAMAYLAEEVHPSALPSAIGLYVAGNSLGGMGARIIPGLVSGEWGWRWGLASVAAVSLGAAAAFRLLLPKARQFRPAPLRPGALARTVLAHLRNPLLTCQFTLALLLMAVFGAVYNVIGYRLTAAPFGMSQGVVGLIFVMYLAGTGSSAAATKLTGTLGRHGVLYAAIGTTAAGLLLSIPDFLPTALLGLGLITAGFWLGHAVASSNVGWTASTGRAQASGLYLTAYYIGNGIGGTLGPDAYRSGGWYGTVLVGLTAVLLAAAVNTRSRLSTQQQLAPTS